MKERPILFSAPMVRAILSGRKTQTRRVVKPQPVRWLAQDDLADLPFVENGQVRRLARWGSRLVECPYGAPGDRLWVRETWRLDGWCETPEATVTYRADGHQDAIRVLVDDYDVFVDHECRRMEAAGAIEDKDGNLALPDGSSPPWRPSIFMPRWASRITLEVTDVRVQRVQDISEEDAAAEGVDPMIVLPGDVLSHVAAFGMLWDSINHKRAPWDANPWVWALTFRVVKP